MTEIRELVLEDATPENFAPFGRMITASAGGDARSTAFYENKVEVRDAGAMVTDDQACIVLAHVLPREPQVQWMERHFKHEQMFVSLGESEFVIVVAPPNEEALPDLDAVRAFRFGGPSPVVLHLGTWHEFPFALSQPVDLAVFLREETNRDLEAQKDGEAVGGDLEKRRIDRRCGVALRYRA